MVRWQYGTIEGRSQAYCCLVSHCYTVGKGRHHRIVLHAHGLSGSYADIRFLPNNFLQFDEFFRVLSI